MAWPAQLQAGVCAGLLQVCVEGEGVGWRDPTEDEIAEQIEDFELLEESCDGLDNDCDGEADAELEQDCSNACGEGTEICVRGEWVDCTAPPVNLCGECGPAPTELCNNADDDCDGDTDEGLTQICSNDCGQGLETCEAGSWVGCSAPPVLPEECNGEDDNCDNEVDNNLFRSCHNACGDGTETCVDGSWEGCTAPPENGCGGCGPLGDEICNGQDDNCDGEIDEGLVRDCSNACGQGTATCRVGEWINCTAPPVNACGGCGPAPAEACNGDDDDCDGHTDEGLTQPCSTPCGDGTETCVAAHWVNCSAPALNACGECGPVPEETCNNDDDNCDGRIDENMSRPCETVCGQGAEVCEAGEWVNCTAPQLNDCGECGPPPPEICNNIDDDCDGGTDEGLSRPCENGCGFGLETCAAGRWGDCSAPVVGPETCNNVDDDCDGDTDEDLTRSCHTACGDGMERCSAGEWVDCDAPPALAETCNGLDDDCNDAVDDGNLCPPGQVCIQGNCN